MGAMNELRILDPNGHSITAWDPGRDDEVQRVREIYEALLRRGYRAFGIERGEGRSQGAFDPRARETLLVPPIDAG